MAEKIETVNNFLRETFGIDTDDSQPIFRVVFSDEQFEKRMSKFTTSGVEMLSEQLMELPKYPHVKGMYVLERRVLVPDMNLRELAGLKKSYEPLWVFHGADGFPVPPTIQGSKFVIDIVLAAQGKKSLANYKGDNQKPIHNAQEEYERKKVKLEQIENELFGDESGLKQETINASGSAIIMPQNYGKVN